LVIKHNNVGFCKLYFALLSLMLEIFVTNFANIWDKKKQLRAGELITAFLFNYE